MILRIILGIALLGSGGVLGYVYGVSWATTLAYRQLYRWLCAEGMRPHDAAMVAKEVLTKDP